MKILCVSDIHGDLDGVVEVRNYLIQKSIKTVFLLGDYTAGFKDLNRNTVDVEYTINILGGNAKVYALPGNCDHPQVLGIFEENKVNFHEKVVELDGMKFIGMGGSPPTPFGTPSELSEDEIYKRLTALFMEAGKGEIGLVTHFTPKDTACDAIPSGAHVGSTALRRVIEERQPLLSVVGHIHESGGKEDKIGRTTVMNVGPLSHGNAVVIDTEVMSLKHVSLG
jgi:Icc-related predicted phosphoesterase